MGQPCKCELFLRLLLLLLLLLVVLLVGATAICLLLLLSRPISLLHRCCLLHPLLLLERTVLRPCDVCQPGQVEAGRWAAPIVPDVVLRLLGCPCVTVQAPSCC